jgi:hypothetical protein
VGRLAQEPSVAAAGFGRAPPGHDELGRLTLDRVEGPKDSE